MDAEWAVCSDPARRGGKWTPDEFFATGEREIAAVLAFMKERGLTVGGRALDFGCGLGRLTRALCPHFSEVVGVDVSPEMIRRAQTYHADLGNCRFVVNERPDLALFPTGHFDFVLSLLALQHVSAAEDILRYIAEFVRVLKPGGVAAFQVPDRIPWRVRRHPLRILVRAAGPRAVQRADAMAPYAMALTPVPAVKVAEALTAAGARLDTAVEDNRFGSRRLRSISYCAVKNPGVGGKPDALS
ncbi:MAG: hypothetical protein QOI98_2067 [Solirubrobacteraceae bacterium]|nr:hypothetical protein [Solirubrobacteraceae bacterium]